MVCLGRFRLSRTGYNSLYVATAAPSGGLIVQGNVGIGTSSPVYGATLDVAGNINMSGLLTQGVPFLQMPGGVFDYNIAWDTVR